MSNVFLITAASISHEHLSLMKSLVQHSWTVDLGEQLSRFTVSSPSMSIFSPPPFFFIHFESVTTNQTVSSALKRVSKKQKQKQTKKTHHY